MLLSDVWHVGPCYVDIACLETLCGMQIKLRNGPKVLISESRKEQWVTEGEGQILAQMAAAREEFVRSSVTGKKRKRSEMTRTSR